MKAFEIQDAEPYYQDLTVVQSSEVQKSSAVLPKRACDLMNTEIARVFKLTGNAVVPVSFSVPRKVSATSSTLILSINAQTKSEFQEDLYPPTPSTEPALVLVAIAVVVLRLHSLLQNGLLATQRNPN